MKILGIDPGYKGGLCILNDNGIQHVISMPCLKINNKSSLDINTILNFINLNQLIDSVFIEKQIVIHNQGLISSSITMFNFGQLLGICYALNLNVNIVPSKTWQKEIFSNLSEDDLLTYKDLKYDLTKIKSISYVSKSYGESYLHNSSRCKKPKDGLADSICIAAYGYNKMCNNNNNNNNNK